MHLAEYCYVYFWRRFLEWGIDIMAFCALFLSLGLLVGCDSDHQREFNNISRDDIRGYEEFIRNYPSSALVPDARDRIEVAKENQRIQKEMERQRQLENTYGNVSLQNGAQPYSRWYGNNLFLDDYTPHSEIQVSAPSGSDVVVIVRYNNQNGNVAGHVYIKAGRSSTIYLRNGHNYQTFFYLGNGWYSGKEMLHGIKGGFVKNESYSKDGSATYMDNDILSYTLTQQVNGNFQTSGSSEGEMF